MFDLLKINGPDDVKKLSAAELPELCEAMRAALIKRAAKHTGHVGPNLGFLETGWLIDGPNIPGRPFWVMRHRTPLLT